MQPGQCRTWSETPKTCFLALRLKPDRSCRSVYDYLVLDAFNLVQIMTEPTRHDDVFDLILTLNPTIVYKVECLPGLSDHDIVLEEVAIKPTNFYILSG